MSLVKVTHINGREGEGYVSYHEPYKGEVKQEIGVAIRPETRVRPFAAPSAVMRVNE